MASLQEMLAARNVAKVQTPEIQTGIVTSANADSAVINGTAILNNLTNDGGPTNEGTEETQDPEFAPSADSDSEEQEPGREPIAWAPTHIRRYMCNGWQYPDEDGLFRASTQKQFDSLQNMAVRGEVTPIYAPSEAIE